MTYTEFLQKFHGARDYSLVAIHPLSNKIEAATFTTLEAVDRWVKQKNGTFNLYFTVNSLKEPIDKKPKREDVSTMDWLHVDIDVQKGEGLKDGLERIRTLAPEGLPPPTVTVFSGGGYQLYWRLKEPIVINGEEARFEDAKLYNVYLENHYGGDSCHNVDRIMRLPGTMNLPTKKKLAKHPGRKPVLATVVDFNEALAYDLSRFDKGVLKSKSHESKPRVDFDVEAVVRVADIDDLDKWNVPQWCRALLVQGDDPEDPTRYNGDRSKALLAACVALTKCKVPSETIYSIITDPAFGISASVLDKGSGIQRYALRQIDRAGGLAEEEEDSALGEMNKMFFTSWIGGKYRAFREEYEPTLKRYALVKIAKEDLFACYDNDKVVIGEDKNGNPKLENKAKYWWGHKSRRKYDRIVFSPGIEVAADHYNLWKGFAYEPVRGDGHEPLLAHLKDNICGGVDEYYKYLLGWMARTVQRPADAGEVAVVLRGKQGTGKGVATRSFGELFGRHYLQVSNTKHLVGNFNTHLRDVVVLFADEAFYAGDKEHEGLLKSLITEPTLTIEGKGVDLELSPNFLHIFMASNSDWVVPAGPEERRFLMLDVADSQMQNSTYFEKIRTSMESGGYANFLHFLQTYSLAGFNVRNVPQTEALKDQKLLNLRGIDRWVANIAADGSLPEGEPELVAKNAVSSRNLLASCKEAFPGGTTCITLGKVLKKYGVKRPANHNEKYYMFPSLSKFREKVREVLGASVVEGDNSAEEWQFLGGDGVLS